MIRELLDSMKFTHQEQAIVQFIKEQPDALLTLNAKELASEAYVSPPTVVRFVKKLGYEGYLDFQHAYIQEYTMHQNEEEIQITSSSSVKEIYQTFTRIYDQVFCETRNMMKQNTVVRTVNYMLQAKRIDFYASDTNFCEVQSACRKLTSIGILAQAYNAMNEDYINGMNPSETLSFVVSHTGSNPVMLEIAGRLREKRCRVIAITGSADSALVPLCNESLYVDSSLHGLPHIIRLDGMSVHYVLDVLIAVLLIKKKKL